MLVTTGPVFVGVGSWLFLGERPSRSLALGIAFALAGSVLVGWADLSRGGGRLVGDLLALGGAVMMARATLWSGGACGPAHSLAAYVAPVYALAAVSLLALAVLASGQPLLGYSSRAYGWLLAMALVPQLVGHSALNWALRHLSATYVAVPPWPSRLARACLPICCWRGGGWAVTLVAGPSSSRASTSPRAPSCADRARR